MSDKNLLKKGISIWLVVIIVLFTVILTFQLTYLGINNKYSKLMGEITLDQNRYSKLAAVDQIFRTYGIVEIDEKQLSDLIITGYVAGTGDRYANYYTAEEFAEIKSTEDGNFDGIGVTVIYNPEFAAIEIISVDPETPAEKAGLLPGDIIIYVNGKSVAELGYYGAIYEIKGEPGTFANITIARKNGTVYDQIDMEVERAVITQKTVSYRMYEGDNSLKKIGIISIQSFDLITSSQFFEAVDALTSQGAEAFVFDVRNNPGGDLDIICEILDHLLPEGPIVRIIFKTGEDEVISSDAEHIDMPMAVLTNRNTASAAELFSAAIKDYKLGKIIGTTTYGKGTAQFTVPLEDGSAVVLSLAKYNPPFSENYNGIGVAPDIEVDLPEELKTINRLKISDSDDTQLQAAISYLNGFEYEAEN